MQLIPFHRTHGIHATLAALKIQCNSCNAMRLAQVNATQAQISQLTPYNAILSFRFAWISVQKISENCNKKKLVATSMMWKLLAHEIIIPVAAFLKEAPCPPWPFGMSRVNLFFPWSCLAMMRRRTMLIVKVWLNCDYFVLQWWGENMRKVKL